MHSQQANPATVSDNSIVDDYPRKTAISIFSVIDLSVCILTDLKPVLL